jgi:GNAT superfamily N-acetyltransferase
MNIIDLDDKHFDIFCCCLEDWSEEIKEAGPHRADWIRAMKERGLGAQLAVEGEKTLGMIQYVPIEHAFAEGKDAYFVHCIWVHGHKNKGVGDQRKKGIGKALLAAAEGDAKNRGAKSMVAWGLSMPFWMKASWFRKLGYKKADKLGMQVLLWKPFEEGAEAPRWIREKKRPAAGRGVVEVTAFRHGWCSSGNITFERAKRAAAEFGDKVRWTEIGTLDRTAYLEWGIADGIYVDGKNIRTGPPLTYAKIRRKISKRVRKLPSKKGMLEVQG